MLGDGADDEGFGGYEAYGGYGRGRGRSRSRSRSRSRDGGDRDRDRDRDRSRGSPRTRRGRGRSWSRSRSPPPRRANPPPPSRRQHSRSRSPPRYRSRSRSPSPPRYRSRSPRRSDGGRDDRRRRDRPHAPGVCFAHQRGHCARGDACRFSHDLTGALPPPPGGSGAPGARGGDPNPPPVGAVLRGVVASVRPFGVFVRMDGYARDGLVHCTQVSDELTFSREDTDDAKVMAMEYFHPPRSDVWVKVVEVRRDGYSGDARVGLSMRLVDQGSGEDLDPDGSKAAALEDANRRGGGRGAPLSDEPPPLNSTHRAAVREVKPYGVFVRLDGFRKNALVPTREVSEHLRFSKDDTDEDRVAGLEGVVGREDQVWVKVVELREGATPTEPPKITCSIRLCDQASGADLDPGGEAYQPGRGGAGVGGGFDPNRRVGADAGDKVGAGGVIDWGHHAGDVKRYGGGGEYELVGEDATLDAETAATRFDGRGPGGLPIPPPPPGVPTGSTFVVDAEGAPAIGSVEEAMAILERHRAEKRAKKEAKKAKKKRRKKEKKAKKEKKRQRRKSSSDSSSASSSDEELS